MKKQVFNIRYCFLISIFLLSTTAYAQKKGGKLASKIVGTWVLQKLDALVREEHKNNEEAQKTLEVTKKSVERESRSIQNALAFTFEKGGKLLVSFADKRQKDIQATWRMEKDILFIVSEEKTFETDLNKSKVFFEANQLYIGMPVNNRVSDASPFHMVCFVFKKGSMKDLESFAFEIRKKPEEADRVVETQSISVHTETMIIGAERVPCQGEGKQNCLQFKKDKSDAEWQNLYENIEGFDFEEGYMYNLLVEITQKNEHIPDKSNITYKLLQIISKEKVK